MEKIPGVSMLGFGDFFEEAYVGAVKPPKKPPAKAPPSRGSKGRVFKAAGPDRSSSPHKKSMMSTIMAGKRAIDAGKKATAIVKAYKPAAHAPLVRLTSSLSPKGTVMLGLAPPKPGALTKRPLTAKQTAAVGKHANAIGKHANAVKRLNALTKKAARTGKDALDYAKKTAPFLKAALAGKRKSAARVGELLGLIEDGFDVDQLGDDDVLGLCEMLGIGLDGLDDQVGQEGEVSPPSDDPNAPDPSLSETGVVTAPDGTVLYDPMTDPGIVPIPERGGVLSQEDAATIWQKVPDDGVVWPVGQAFAVDSVGSWSERYGIIITGVAGAETGKLLKVGYTWAGSRWAFSFVGMAPSVSLENVTTSAIANASLAGQVPRPGGVMATAGGGIGPTELGGATFGPLVGNPKQPEVASLQYAITDAKWFWQGNNAPKTATTEVDAKIILANQKTVAANTAAAQVEAARLAKVAADKAEAQAKIEAEQALAQTAAEAERTVAETKAETADITARQAQEATRAQADIEREKSETQSDIARQQAEVERERAATQVDIEREKLAVEREKAEMAMEAEAQHALVAEAAQYNAWAKAHPEQAYAVKERAVAEDEAEMAAVEDEMAAEAESEMAAAEAPSMFEESAQPQVDDDFASPDWPHDEEV